MSVIDMFLKRRARACSAAPRRSQSYQPRLEVLEERQCLSVAAPANLQLTAVSSTQVKLTWNNVAGELGFRVLQWDGTKTNLVTTVNKDVLTFTVSNLQPNQTQWFRIEAFDISSSAQSAWASVVTPPTPIAAPGNVKVGVVTQTQVNLSWTNAAGATGYRVYSWNGTQAVLLGTTTPTVPAFTVSNLTPGVNYYFYVQSFNATNSATSAWVSATTLSPGITAPTNLKTQVVNASTIGLSWNDVASETGYRVYRWDGVTGTNPVVIATLAVNTTGYQATGLAPGKTYWFYVQAFNATSYANTAWITATTGGVPLQAPTQLAISVTGPNSVVLSWAEPVSAAGYGVYIWNGISWTLVTNVAKGIHSVPVVGLAANRTHWFMVQAYTDNFTEIKYSSAVFVNL